MNLKTLMNYIKGPDFPTGGILIEPKSSIEESYKTGKGSFRLRSRWEQEKLKLDDVLGVWPLHGIAGSWGGIACGIFGQEALGGLGQVSFLAQLTGTLFAIVIALFFGFTVYFLLDKTLGIRLESEDEQRGSDLVIHNIESHPEDATSRF